MNDLRNALALGREIAARRLTAVKVLEAALARIEARDNEILAWKLINPEQALAEAMARDAEEPKGPLHGVPVGVKDVLDTSDIATGYGSAIYEGALP
ncbi:MAG: amidase family protein, partial [Rhodospirillales bacterium]